MRINKKENYDELFDDVKERNRVLLSAFREDLKDASPITAKRHLANIDVFLDEYLYRMGYENIHEGAENIRRAFSFYVYTCLASPDSVRKMGATLRKFYRCMEKCCFVSKEEVENVDLTITIGMPGWLTDREG